MSSKFQRVLKKEKKEIKRLKGTCCGVFNIEL